MALRCAETSFIDFANTTKSRNRIIQYLSQIRWLIDCQCSYTNLLYLIQIHIIIAPVVKAVVRDDSCAAMPHEIIHTIGAPGSSSKRIYRCFKKLVG